MPNVESEKKAALCCANASIQLLPAGFLCYLINNGDFIRTIGAEFRKSLPSANRNHIKPKEILSCHHTEYMRRSHHVNEFETLHNKEIGFFDGETEKNNVVSLIKRHAETKPNGTAFRFPDRSLLPVWGDTVETQINHKDITFGKFFDLVCRTATGLTQLGIKPHDRVIIFLPMSIPLYQTMAAVQMIGASAVFLDSWARRDQLGVSAEIAGATAMISFEQAFIYCSEEPGLASIPIKIVTGQHKGSYTGQLEKIQNSPACERIEPVTGRDTALITFTTGSSGRPKGADRTHEFLAAQHYALNKCIPYTESDLDLPAFPIFSLNNLAAGVTTVIPVIDIGRPSEKDPLMLASQMLSLKITCATLSPSMMVGVSRFCDRKGIEMPFVRRIITGGAPIGNDTLALMKRAASNAKIWVLYGSTEVEPIAHIEATEILSQAESTEKCEGVNVGHFAEGLETRFIKIRKTDIDLTNETWQSLEVPPGEVGELVVAGLHVCKSYYNDLEAVKRAKIIEPSGKIWHRTGDLAFQDNSGNLWLVGRVHNAILRGERMLFPVKVEMLLKQHQHVCQAAFLGVPDRELGEKAYALVQLDASSLSKSEEILCELKTALDNADIPYDRLAVCDNIPMDPRHHSKVEYSKLRELVLSADHAGRNTDNNR